MNFDDKVIKNVEIINFLEFRIVKINIVLILNRNCDNVNLNF